MKYFLLIVTFCLSTNFSFGQFYKNYSWEEVPVYEDPTMDHPSKSTVGLKKVSIVEFFEGSQIMIFETTHEKIFVLDEAGIQQNNKVYISMYNVSSILDIKARTITSDGKTQLMDRSNIKEVKNVEEYGDFKIFAIEGVEPESNIEIIYTVKKQYYPFGWETIQENYPIMEAKFMLVYGKNNARVKSYQTTATVKVENIGGNTAQVLTLQNVPAMLEEDFATPNSNKISVAYQCFGKSAVVTDKLIWSNVTKNICADAFPLNPSKRASKDIKQYATSQDLENTFSKALWVDSFIKSEYTVTKSGNKELGDVNYVLKNKMGNDSGILDAYGHYLTALGVEYEVVLTANRYIHNFDPYFFTPRAIQDFLIYIPELKQYIAPSRLEYRLGEAPFNVLGNGAVFVKKSLRFVGGVIKQNDPDFSRIKRITDVSFEADLSKVTLDQYQEYYGHWAVSNRAVIQFSGQSDIEGFKDYLTGSGIEDKISIDYSVENENIDSKKYNTPFIVNSKISSESMIENAGESYIFLVGMVIGTQSELYQEEDRVNPILSRYPNVYNYTITVQIPEGFKPEGLDDLKIYQELKRGEKIICKFESDYEIVEDSIVISIEEFYKEIDIPVADYADFRNVINAASDFNKKSILFTEK